MYARDEYGLPVKQPNSTEPLWIIKRRQFLKTLSVQDRNLLLTGDPYFQFDPVVYSCVFFSPWAGVPPILQQNFPYLIPQHIDVEIQADLTSDSDSEADLNPAPEENFDTCSSGSFSDSSSDNVPCAPVLPPTPPGRNDAPVIPSKTRSGAAYSGSSKPPQSGSKSGFSGLLSRAGALAGSLLDAHPLASGPFKRPSSLKRPPPSPTDPKPKKPR